MTDVPETPPEDLPQDPGTSGSPADDDQPPGSAERPEPQTEETKTDGAGRAPRQRSGV